MDERMFKMLVHWTEKERHNLEALRDESRELKVRGSLIVRKCRGYLLFAEKYGGREHGITHEPDRVRRLARKRFLEREIKNRSAFVRLLEDLSKKYRRQGDGSSFGPLWEEVEVLKNARFSAQMLDWLHHGAGPDSQNLFAPEDLRYSTAAGITVRSKSERTIADALTRYGLPFKYEAAFRCTVEGTNVLYYPDFTILRSDGHEVIWEHLGLVENSSYLSKSMRKLSNYMLAGLSLADDLIITLESDLQDPRRLEEIIFRFLI